MSTIVATNIEDLDTGDIVSVSNLITINDQRPNYGLVPSNNSGDVTNDIDFTAGKCWDTTGTNYITVAAMTKQADAPWAAGTNAGMMDTGTFTADSCYYFWAIYKDSDGTGDIIMSLADTWAGVNKTLITGYTTGQLIHALTSIMSLASWQTVDIVGNYVHYGVNSNEIISTSMTSGVASTFTINMPKMTECEATVNLQVSVGASTMSVAIMPTSRSGAGNDRFGAYVALTVLNLGNIAASQSVIVDENSQISAGAAWNNGGLETLRVYFYSYNFHRRFAGT